LTDKYSIKHSSISWDFEPYSLKKLLNKTVTSTGKEVNFINLPLNLSELEKNSIVKGVPNALEMFGKENPSVFHHYPHLKIKQIILGYQIDPKVSFDIGDQVEAISEGKIGYQPKLKFSDFSDDFKV
jgi:hypothetical protein